MSRRRSPIAYILPQQNLDSFLDILANTVGILMFIGIFVSLTAVENSTTVRTPLQQSTNKKSHYLELSRNQVFDLPFDLIKRQLDSGRINIKIENETYSIKASLTEQQFRLKSSAKGDTAEQVRLKEGILAETLVKLDPDEVYIVFLVRDDSFSIFHTARQQAWNFGFDVGWEPLGEINRPIIFGESGRKTSPQ